MAESKTNTENASRALGHFESLFALLSVESMGVYWHSAVLNTLYELQMKDVYKAWRILVSKQEALQMRIVPTKKGNNICPPFHFVRMDDPEKMDIKFDAIKQKDDWPLYISKDLEDKKIDMVNGPLWRFILLSVEETDNCRLMPYQYVLLLKLDHTIVDGLSAFNLLNHQLLPILSALISGKDAQNMIPFIPQTTSIEESIQSTKDPISVFFKWKIDFRRWKNRVFQLSKQPHYKFTEDPTVMDEKHLQKVTCIPKIFDETLCRSVIHAATTHGVTVHSILLLADVVAFSRTAKLADIELPSHIKQIWPISLRKYITFKPPEPLGFLVAEGSTIHETVTKITFDEFWKRCKEVSIHVKEEGMLEKVREHLKVYQYIEKAAMKSGILALLSEMGAPCHLFLSNLGNTDTQEPAHIIANEKLMEVTEQYFCVTGLKDECYPAFSQFLLTFKNRFMWNVTYNPSKISKTFIETYLHELENVLISFCIL